MTKKRENYKLFMRKQYKGGRKGKLYRPPLMPRLGEGAKEDRKLESEVPEEVGPKPGKSEYSIWENGTNHITQKNHIGTSTTPFP